MPKRKLSVDAALGYIHTEADFSDHTSEAYVEAGLARTKVEDDKLSVEADILKYTSTGNNVIARAKLASVKETKHSAKRRCIAEARVAYSQAEDYVGDNEAGGYAETGLGKGKVEAGVFNADANVLKLSGEFKVSPTEARLMTRPEIGGLSVGLGPVKVKIGRNIDTGVKVGNDGVELKFLGDGMKIGNDGVEAEVLGNGFTFTKDKVGVKILGTGFKAGKHGMEIKAFGIGFEIKF